MGIQLDEEAFELVAQSTRRGRPEKYPWGEWLNGKPWSIERGVDFEQSANNMRSTIYSAAKRRGISVVVHAPTETTLYFRADS